MKKNNKIILASIIGMLVLLIGGKIIHNTYMISSEEKEKIAIDKHNFTQLEVITEVLENEGDKDIKFFGIKEFNKKFQKNIISKKNCIYISSDNGNEDYIVGFKLESKKYIAKYGTEYYAYPRYDIESHFICDGISCDSDINQNSFEYIISNPCKD